ncbi:MAG: 30S ribosomal protein S4 [Chloroflexi bacterium]|nr:30S ribosomal protein S4 [Chloroflexota bacterium]
MGRYTGPVCRLCRRMGTKLFLKGERCFTPRCAVEKRRSAPGEQQREGASRRRISEHGMQLREKQKARFIYGLLERQFSNDVEEASRTKGATGQLLMELLERRLDNVVYRLGFADSRKQARQMVGHGHFMLNGRGVNIPSLTVKAGDTLGWRERSTKSNFYKTMIESLPKRPVPQWLDLDKKNVTGKVVALPAPSDIDTSVDTRPIVEYYSRR